MDYVDMPGELLLAETANYLNFICTDAKGLRQMNDFFKRMNHSNMIRIPKLEGTANDIRRQLMNDAFRLAIFIQNTPGVHRQLPRLLEVDGVSYKKDHRVPVIFVLALGMLYSNPERPYRLLRLFLDFCDIVGLDPKPLGGRTIIRMVISGKFRADFTYHPASVDEMKPTTKQWLANHLHPDDLPKLLKGYTTVAQQLDFLDFALGCDHLIEAAKAGGQLWLKGINTLRQEIEMGCLLEGKEAPDNQLLAMHNQLQCLTAELEATTRQLKDRQRQIDQDKQDIAKLSLLVASYEKSINDFYECFVGWKSSFWQHGDSNPQLPPSQKLGHLLPGLNNMILLANTMYPYLDGQIRIKTDDIVNYCCTQNLRNHQVKVLVCMLRYFSCKMGQQEDRMKLEQQCQKIEKAREKHAQQVPAIAKQTTINNHFTSDQLQYVNKGGKAHQLNYPEAPVRTQTTSEKHGKQSGQGGMGDNHQQDKTKDQ